MHFVSADVTEGYRQLVVIFGALNAGTAARHELVRRSVDPHEVTAKDAGIALSALSKKMPAQSMSFLEIDRFCSSIRNSRSSVGWNQMTVDQLYQYVRISMAARNLLDAYVLGTDGDSSVRIQAIRMLASIPDCEALLTIGECLYDGHEAIRVSAYYSLPVIVRNELRMDPGTTPDVSKKEETLSGIREAYKKLARKE